MHAHFLPQIIRRPLALCSFLNNKHQTNRNGILHFHKRSDSILTAKNLWQQPSSFVNSGVQQASGYDNDIRSKQYSDRGVRLKILKFAYSI